MQKKIRLKWNTSFKYSDNPYRLESMWKQIYSKINQLIIHSFSNCRLHLLQFKISQRVDNIYNTNYTPFNRVSLKLL